MALLPAVALSTLVNLALGLRLKATTRLPEQRRGAVRLRHPAAVLPRGSHGGVQNPFASLLMVPIALAAATLDLRSTVGITVLALVCIAILALAGGPLPWRDGGLALPALYRVGGWAALSMAAVLIAVFAWSVAEEARQRSEALTATQLALAREQQLSALGGQAAAVAHLLGTPLATINIIAKELVRELPDGSPLAEEAVDPGPGQALPRAPGRARQARRRGRGPILHQGAVQQHARAHRGRVRAARGRGQDRRRARRRHARAARRADPELRHSLANLIDNAIQFAEAEVRIRLRPSRSELLLVIEDDGPGFPPEVLDWLGEPFLSTRREQGGLGLGIFIANTLLARTGAKVHFDNKEQERGSR